MNLRLRIGLALLLLAAIASLWLRHRLRLAPGRGPVVVYLVDTLRFDRMSAYGAPRPTSPAAQALAREGVRYDFAYSVSSWTRPGVAALFASRWPAEIGVYGRGGAIREGVTTLPTIFHAQRWRTAAFCGNYLISDEGFGFRRGFDLFQLTLSIPEQDRGIPVAQRVVGPAIEWLRGQRDPRFLLYVHVMDPHSDWGENGNPYRHWSPGYENLFPTGRTATISDREWSLSRYDALIRQADDQFAALRRELEIKGWWDSALVLYVADHGEEFYEHGATGHGETLFEEVLRVPMIVKGPAWGRPGSIVPAPVSLLDLLPSIAGWARFPSDASWRGRRLDRQDPSSGETTLYFSNELDRARQYALRSGSKKVIASLTPPFRVEFDLERDPAEQTPISVEPALAEKLERLRRSETATLGGLWIRKRENVPVGLRGFVELPGAGMPYLSLSDRDRFPLAAGDPERLPISVDIPAGDRFEAHFLTLDREAFPRARLRHSGSAIEIADRPRSTLTPQQLNETTARMRALGYLGGN